MWSPAVDIGFDFESWILPPPPLLPPEADDEDGLDEAPARVPLAPEAFPLQAEDGEEPPDPPLAPPFSFLPSWTR